MCYHDWEEENWDTLIYSIQNKNCILMLGPDTAVEEVEGKRLTLTEILAKELAVSIKPEYREEINTSDLAQVAQYYCKEKGRDGLEVKVSNFYNERNEVNDLYRCLAKLPFYLTVTVSHDKKLQAALEEKNEIIRVEYYNFRGDNPKIIEKWYPDEEGEKKLVYYLYGAIDKAKSLVLTEDDLLDFLVKLISDKKPIPKNILSQLHDENKCFLFLGMGFRHWYMRIFLHVLQGEKKLSPSLAMEQSVPPPIDRVPLPIDSDQLRQDVFFFRRRDCKIHIFKQDLECFVAELHKKFKKSPTDPVRTVIHKEGPKVFICHAHENKDDADNLYEEFKAEGLRPWLDNRSLRGGDLWDSEIEKTIENVDYFVVLQSSALAEINRRYVIKEIKFAKKCCEYFREGMRFIIPVSIDDSPPLTELSKFQTEKIDINKEEDINELISLIKRDFGKRGNR
jgi:hypothetical protein